MSKEAVKRSHTLAVLLRVTCTSCGFEWLEREPEVDHFCLRCNKDTVTMRPFDIEATPTKKLPLLEIVT
jgi:predicted Zn-ribbon and HTH transcriptional regulator